MYILCAFIWNIFQGPVFQNWIHVCAGVKMPANEVDNKYGIGMKMKGNKFAKKFRTKLNTFPL